MRRSDTESLLRLLMLSGFYTLKNFAAMALPR